MTIILGKKTDSCTDYYSEKDSGCCLICENSEPGCLCYECKCTKCYWYIEPEDWNGEEGKCGITLKKSVNPFPLDLKKRYFDVKKLFIKPSQLKKEVFVNG